MPQAKLMAAMVIGVVGVTLLGAVHAAAPAVQAPNIQHLNFNERSPLSAPNEVFRRLDYDLHGKAPADGDPRTADYDLAGESFDVLVPANYDAGDPPGLLVWMGVSDFSPQWFDVLARRKLIYVHASKSTGQGPSRMGLPLDGVHNLKLRYKIDEKRIYVCGFSAGAGAAASLIAGYPDVFRGGLFLNSGPFCMALHNKEPSVMTFMPTWKGPLDEIRKSKSLVLMWGERDPQYTPAECRAQYDSLVLDGFERASYFIVPGEGHAPPNVAWFEKGLTALDDTKLKPRPTTAPTTQPHPLPGQIAQARRILAAAQIELDQRDHDAKRYPAAAARAEARARGYLQRVLDEYPTTPAASRAREMLNKLDRATTQPASTQPAPR